MRSITLDTIDQLDRLYDSAESVDCPLEAAAQYAAAAHRIGDMLARAGLSDLYRRSLDFGGLADWPPVKAYLAECLASLEPRAAATPVETLTVQDVAAMLGITERSVWRRRADGTLPPAMKIGRLVRWARADVEKFIGRG